MTEQTGRMERFCSPSCRTGNEKEAAMDKDNKPEMPPQDEPATEKQRKLLKLAVEKKELEPNPFAGQHEKWQNLTAGEADDLLKSIPKEKLGVLEEELRRKEQYKSHRLAHAVGRSIGNAIHEIGRTIDGGF